MVVGVEGVGAGYAGMSAVVLDFVDTGSVVSSDPYQLWPLRSVLLVVSVGIV